MRLRHPFSRRQYVLCHLLVGIQRIGPCYFSAFKPAFMALEVTYVARFAVGCSV